MDRCLPFLRRFQALIAVPLELVSCVFVLRHPLKSATNRWVARLLQRVYYTATSWPPSWVASKYLEGVEGPNYTIP